ncbi:hypothetical protein D3C71_2062660 [compost metagenome]
MQLPVVGRHALQFAPVGLDFFEAVLPGVVTVRPALDGQLPVLALQRDFVLIGRAAPRGHGAMTDDAFQRRG